MSSSPRSSSPSRTDDLSAGQARRLALASQGFTDARPAGRVDRRHLRRVLKRVGMVQIDSVNVLVRSQELPLFARLGPHPRTLIADATAAGDLFEYWGHEASHIPTEQHRLFRWKMKAAAATAWPSVVRLQRERPGFVAAMLARIEADGPVVAGDVSVRNRPKGAWWDWDDAKRALEFLFWTGQVTAWRRSNDFTRIYDLPERVIPRAHLEAPTPTEREARTELMMIAARAMGVATHTDLAMYHRQNIPKSRPALHDLIEAGRLVPVGVEGWRQVAYMHPGARIPERVSARALVSPFDSVAWERDRLERVFGFRYRIEIYVPKPQRVYGYYVLPFLLGDEFVARVDLKADRKGGALMVQGAYAEPGVPEGLAAEELVPVLNEMAVWLGLERVEVDGRGDLSPAIAATIAAHNGREPVG